MRFGRRGALREGNVCDSIECDDVIGVWLDKKEGRRFSRENLRPSFFSLWLTKSVDDFEQASSAHAAADAHRDDAPALAFLGHGAKEGARHAGARDAEWVAESDRAAVRVDVLVCDAELLLAVGTDRPGLECGRNQSTHVKKVRMSLP